MLFNLWLGGFVGMQDGNKLAIITFTDKNFVL